MLNLADFEAKAKAATKYFWSSRSTAALRQAERGASDIGGRAGVTAGKNMDGFVSLLVDVITANGIEADCIGSNRSVLTLPGFFRPTKVWDIVVIRDGHLIAAIELKSQVGSFGNNFNNRAEESIGSAQDLWTAYREGAFGISPRPFLGWLMMVEDAPNSRRPVNDRCHNFPILAEFANASYLQRYAVLCQKLVQERLYTSAALLASSREAGINGEYCEISELTGLKTFIATLAGHVASAVARSVAQ